MKRYIYGFGGTSPELAELLSARHEHFSGFVVDREYLSACGNDTRVISFENYLKIHEENINTTITIALGEPIYREKLSLRLDSFGVKQYTIKFEEYVASSAQIGEGSILNLGSVVAPNCSVGKCCFINTSAILSHDCTLGNYSVLSPNITVGGHAKIGSRSFVGLGACIRDRVRIGDDVIVGMGAVVTHDIEDGVVVYGNPARIVRRNEAHKVFR